jgi:phage terminase Nu1 subunit (DNA packaging protein)
LRDESQTNAKVEWTQHQLAESLGITVRTLQRYLDRGLPPAAPGETLVHWIARAKPWIAANRRKSGPKKLVAGDGLPVAPGGTTDQLERWRRFRADREELELQARRGQVHSKAECEQEAVRRLAELVAGCKMLPDRLARRWGHAIPPDEVKETVDSELREIFDAFARGTAPAEEEQDDAGMD